MSYLVSLVAEMKNHMTAQRKGRYREQTDSHHKCGLCCSCLFQKAENLAPHSLQSQILIL